MVYGELGIFPLEIKVTMRIVSYWNKLLQNENLSSSLYRLLLSLKHNGAQTFKWLTHVESTFNDSGLVYIFHSQDSSDYTRIKLLLNQILKDQFIQRWTSEMINSSRGQFYSNFKTEVSFENYLTRLSENNRRWITKLRTCNLKLPIEMGRWKNIPRENRTCHLCNEEIGNEFLYLFICSFPYLLNLRKQNLFQITTQHTQVT
jgi:hypothetical protein